MIQYFIIWKKVWNRKYARQIYLFSIQWANICSNLKHFKAAHRQIVFLIKFTLFIQYGYARLMLVINEKKNYLTCKFYHQFSLHSYDGWEKKLFWIVHSSHSIEIDQYSMGKSRLDDSLFQMKELFRVRVEYNKLFIHSIIFGSKAHKSLFFVKIEVHQINSRKTI